MMGNGSHLIYRDEAGSCSSRLAGNLPSLDIRGAGGFIVAAPSKHRSGRRYHVDETLIAPLPSWAKEPPPGFRAPAATVAPPQLPIISASAPAMAKWALRDELRGLLAATAWPGPPLGSERRQFSSRTVCRRRADRAATGL